MLCRCTNEEKCNLDYVFYLVRIWQTTSHYYRNVGDLRPLLGRTTQTNLGLGKDQHFVYIHLAQIQKNCLFSNCINLCISLLTVKPDQLHPPQSHKMPELAEVKQNEKVVAEEPVARIEDDDDDDSDDDIPDLEDASEYFQKN